MKLTLTFLAPLLIIFGAIWFLQGINVLPGSFMTGRIEWTVIGGAMIAAGIGLLVFGRKRKG